MKWEERAGTVAKIDADGDIFVCKADVFNLNSNLTLEERYAGNERYSNWRKAEQTVLDMQCRRLGYCMRSPWTMGTRYVSIVVPGWRTRRCSAGVEGWKR